MKSLAKWQVISFISRGVAMALGIIQSFVILRILSVSEWGIVQIAMSVGGAFGIYQHLGLSSGLTREIAAAQKDEDVFKKFLTGVAIRYCVTLPISVFLFVAAPSIAVNQYSEPALTLLIRIYSVVLLLQSVQSLFDAVVSGTKRFKPLFIYQAAIAVVSVILYIPLVYLYKVPGYFYALFWFNLVSSITFGVIAFKPLKGKLHLPTREDFKVLLKDLLSISLAIYAVKIIYTWWEKIGPLLLGLSVSKEMVGYLAFGILYGKKIMMISDSVTAVNLPVLSDKFVNDIREFKRLFMQNFDKVFAFVLFAAMTAIYWSREVIWVFVGGDKYDKSLPLILPMVFAFVFYGFINIVKSSVIVPAKLIKELIAGFVLMFVATLGFYFGLKSVVDPLRAMSWGMVGGSLLGFLFLTFVSQIRLKFKFFAFDHALILVQALAVSVTGMVNILALKIALFVVFAALFFWAIFAVRFVEKSDVQYIVKRLRSPKT